MSGHTSWKDIKRTRAMESAHVWAHEFEYTAQGVIWHPACDDFEWRPEPGLKFPDVMSELYSHQIRCSTQRTVEQNQAAIDRLAD